jgi:tetratricopeptide (TPR) repeat protein
MYGGMDRNAYPQLKAGDEQLIRDATGAFSSREAASKAWVDQGFRFYNNNDSPAAMRRFNQAWLLNPKNPEVYWGFAAVLYDRNQYCQALNMVELGMSKGSMQPGFLPDAALIYTGCGWENKALTPEARQAYYLKSEELFAKAYADPSVRKEYTLFHWARAMYARADYAGAWAKVSEYRKVVGKEFAEEFLVNLRAKMPEPK